ncbi:uncharacterized protein LOC133204658 [Saccostrea echinata]|uniref:uncharacterized protein LOC133204658 n=1 Tax=Saccostrea echinata TaxID=191078 RepID=UPI002A7ED9D9|nr:uncharacterized protein LOC133204658 [Saccostrea echinata]
MPWTTNRIPKTTTITKLKPGPPVLATTTMMIIKIPTTHTTRMGERPSAIKTTHNNMLKKQITSKTVSIKTTRKIKATSLTKTASTELARVVEYEITLAFLETKLRTGYYTKVMVKGLNAESSTEVNVLIDGSYPEPKAPESTSLNICEIYIYFISSLLQTTTKM